MMKFGQSLPTCKYKQYTYTTLLAAYPSSTNVATSSMALKLSWSRILVAEVSDIARGLVIATLSVKLLPNTRAFDWPQVLDTTAPEDIDHHKLVLVPDSNLYNMIWKILIN